MEVNSKNIIITGASSGIGLALLNLLIEYEGVKIIAVARHIETIPSKDGVVFPFSADLSNEAGVDGLFDYSLSILGHIDLFIANAGFAYMEKLTQSSWDHIEKIYSLNVFSPIYSLEKFINQSLSGSKYFVCTSSAVSAVPLPYYSLYCSTKAGIHQFMETFRYEENENLRIMTVYPVATRTSFFTKASNEKEPPLPFLTQSPEIVAKSVVKGIIKNKKKVYPSFLFRVFNRLASVFPFFFKVYSWNEKRKVEKYLDINA